MDLKDVLKEKDIKIETSEISSLINKKGVLVKAVVKGGKNSYVVSPKIYGIKDENLTDDSKAFLDEHTKNGRVTFVPKDDDDLKELGRAEAALRKKIKTLSIGLDDSFIPKESLSILEDDYLKQKERFDTAKEKLVNRYSAIYENFIRVFKQSIEDFNATEGRVELDRVLETLPTKEKFEESFEFGLYISEFPTVDPSSLNLQQDAIKQMVDSSLVKVIDLMIEALSNVITSGADKGKIHHKTLSGIKNAITRIRKDNIFGNEQIIKLADNMNAILKTDADEAIELCERYLAGVFHYAKTIGLENKINLNPCPFSKRDLEENYEMYNS